MVAAASSGNRRGGGAGSRSRAPRASPRCRPARAGSRRSRRWRRSGQRGRHRAHQRRGGERRDALAAAGEAEPLGGGRLDADPLRARSRRCAASAARIAAACGPIFGASQISVQSRWLIAKPRSPARSTALRRKISEAAPFHAGSDGGNHWPMSPSASAPKIASVSACMPTSASEWPTRPRSMATAHAAERHPVAGAEGVHVEAVAGADVHASPPVVRVAGARSRSAAVVILKSASSPGDERAPRGRRRCATATSSSALARCGAVRGEDRGEAEALRGLGAPQALAAARSPSPSRPAPRQSASTTGSAGKAAGARRGRRATARDHRRRARRGGRRRGSAPRRAPRRPASASRPASTLPPGSRPRRPGGRGAGRRGRRRRRRRAGGPPGGSRRAARRRPDAPAARPPPARARCRAEGEVLLRRRVRRAAGRVRPPRSGQPSASCPSRCHRDRHIVFARGAKTIPRLGRSAGGQGGGSVA